MNAKLEKLIRNYAAFSGVPTKMLRDEYFRADDRGREEYKAEMIKVQELKRTGRLTGKEAMLAPHVMDKITGDNTLEDTQETTEVENKE